MVDTNDFILIDLNKDELHCVEYYTGVLSKIKGDSAIRKDPEARKALKPLDTYIGVMGELAFYHLFYGEASGYWEYACKAENHLASYNRTGSPNDGGSDIAGLPVDFKSSKFINSHGSFRNLLNMNVLVTGWSYDKDKIYPQAFVEFAREEDCELLKGTGRVILSGWVKGSELSKSERFPGSYAMQVRDTHPINTLELPLAV